MGLSTHLHIACGSSQRQQLSWVTVTSRAKPKHFPRPSAAKLAGAWEAGTAALGSEQLPRGARAGTRMESVLSVSQEGRAVGR